MVRRKYTYFKIYAYRAWICYLAFFVAVNTFSEKRTFSETENRVLQTKPTFSIEKLLEGRFIGKYEDYKVDQFYNRDFWNDVKVKTDKLLLKKESKGVYLGKDDYLLEQFDKPNEENVANNLKAINSLDKSKLIQGGFTGNMDFKIALKTNNKTKTPSITKIYIQYKN